MSRKIKKLNYYIIFPNPVNWNIEDSANQFRRFTNDIGIGWHYLRRHVVLSRKIKQLNYYLIFSNTFNIDVGNGWNHSNIYADTSEKVKQLNKYFYFPQCWFLWRRMNFKINFKKIKLVEHSQRLDVRIAPLYWHDLRHREPFDFLLWSMRHSIQDHIAWRGHSILDHTVRI